jgi:biotin synthase
MTALDRIQVSIGTAAVLGLAELRMSAAPTTAYLMLGGRCAMACAFCAQARDSEAGSLHLSRVIWPEYNLDDVVPRLAQAVSRGALRRACLQVTVGAGAYRHALAVLRAVKGHSAVPFDVAILPRDLDQVRGLVEAGADHVGFGLDAACQEVFDQVKGGDWHRSLALVEDTARAFPGRAALHLIVGLGETEQQMVDRIQWAHDRGITVGLFAFTPVRGTALAGRPPPPLDVYRRMQAVRWLIVHGQAYAGEMSFDAAGRLLDPGVPLPADGKPFRTSGCPDCNRPYYNERPTGPMYNYPCPLTPAEAARAARETGWGASFPNGLKSPFGNETLEENLC